ncbi:MAG: choice-of-anchor D domain-containing protein [Pirellulaceae bacterium]|nr:choice-of-anchor D domain-containing protein [Pirellulaceae bacterium]
MRPLATFLGARHRRQPNRSFRQPAASRRLRLEPLEDRRLLAVNFVASTSAGGGFLNGHVLGLLVPAGSDRLLTFQSSVDQNSVTAVSYNGMPMTQSVGLGVGTGSNARIWTLPLGSGGAINSSFVLSTSGGAAVGSISGAVFSGVNQVTPIDDSESTTVAIGANNSSLNVNSEPGDLVVDAITVTSTVDFPSLSPMGGQTSLGGGGGGSGMERIQGGASRKPGTSPSQTVGWTIFNNLPTEQGAHVALNINQVHPAEMNVVGNGMSIADGDTTPSPADHTDFGSANIATGMVTRTFTIQNLNSLGDAPLNLTGTPRVQLSGAGAGSFSVTMLPSATVGPASSTTFQIQFDPNTVGLSAATVSIANDDSNENPYNFAIQGTGTADATAELSGGVLTVLGTAIDNDLLIEVAGANLQITEGNGVLGALAGVTQVNGGTVTVPLASVTSIVVNTLAGDDALTIDFGVGNPVPAGGLSYNGGAQTSGDELVLTGGSFASAVYGFQNENDGTIDLTGTGTITYTGLEPISSSITAANVTLNYSTTAETITVTDAGGGQTTVDSNVGGEMVTFDNPTNSLTINAGNSGNDVVNINSLAANYPASISIDGQGGGDTINLNTPLLLGAAAPASLTFIAESINLNANIGTDGNATAGNVTLTGSVVLGAGLTIDTNSTSDGNVTFNGTVNGAQSLAIDAGSTNSGGMVTFNGLVGGGTALASLSVVADVTLLNGGAITTTGLLELDDTNILLDSPTNTTTLTSTMGGNVILGFANTPFLRSAVDGVEALIVNTSGRTELDARIGEGGQRLSSIATDAPGTLSIDAVAIITTGSQNYNDSTAFLQNSLTATSTGGGSVAFAGTLDENLGAFASDMTVNTTGPVSFGGAVGQTTPLDSVTVTNSSTTTLAAAMAAVGNVVLTASSHVTQSAGLITSSAGGVQLNAGGNVTTTGITAAANTVNGNTDTIKIVAAGTVNVNGPLTATSAPDLNIDIDPVDVNVNANMTATGDIDIVADNDVTIAGGVTIEADSDNMVGETGGTLTIIADLDDNIDDGTGGTLLANVGSNLLGAVVDLGGDVVIVDNMTGKVDDAEIFAHVDATLTGAAVAGDDVLITALLGNLVIAATASAMAADDVELDADGTVDIDGPLTAGEDVEIQLGFLGQGSVFIDAHITANGNVEMFPDEPDADVLIDSGAIITSDADMSGGGVIEITADRDVIQNNGSLVSNTGGISILTFLGNVQIVSAVSDGLNQFAPFALANASGAAALQIRAGVTAIVTGLVATAGDVEVVALLDHAYLGSIDAGANIAFVEALFGRIIDNNGAALNVTAGALSLDADQGIGDGNAIEVDLTTLSAFNFTGGNIEVADIGGNASPLTIGTVVDQVPGVNNLAAGGNVILSNLSPIVVADPVTAAAAIQLTSTDLVVTASISSTAGGNIDLFSNNVTRTFAIGSGAAVKGSGLTTGSAAYGLDDAELDLITTGGQRRVNGDSGTDLFNVNYGGSDTQPIYVLGMAGDDEFFVAPATTMPINLDGGLPSAPAMPGDTLHLDMSGTVAPVIVDTIGGYAISASTAVVSFVEMETLDLCDDSGDIDNADIGDLYVRSTNNRERITFTSWNDTGVKLRIDDLTLGTSTTYPQHFGLVAGSQMLQQILVYAQDGDDLVSIAAHVVDAGLNPIPVEFHGEDGNDYLTGANADDILVGGPGNDRVLGGEGNNLLFGDGNQFDMGGMLIELPTDGNDNISGRGGDDTLWGGGGADTMFGSDGDDVLNGGSGNDLLDGGLGTDILRGGDGNDTLSGGYGDDVLLGGAGDDSLFGRQDNDILIGGTGADQIRGDAGSDLLVAGTTDQDSATDAALLALLAAWSGGGVNNLTGITGDGDRDDLQGGTGIDEFWAEILPDPPLDLVRDAALGESVNNEA